MMHERGMDVPACVFCSKLKHGNTPFWEWMSGKQYPGITTQNHCVQHSLLNNIQYCKPSEIIEYHHVNCQGKTYLSCIPKREQTLGLEWLMGPFNLRLITKYSLGEWLDKLAEPRRCSVDYWILYVVCARNSSDRVLQYICFYTP